MEGDSTRSIELPPLSSGRTIVVEFGEGVGGLQKDKAFILEIGVCYRKWTEIEADLHQQPIRRKRRRMEEKRGRRRWKRRRRRRRTLNVGVHDEGR